MGFYRPPWFTQVSSESLRKSHKYANTAPRWVWAPATDITRYCHRVNNLGLYFSSLSNLKVLHTSVGLLKNYRFAQFNSQPPVKQEYCRWNETKTFRYTASRFSIDRFIRNLLATEQCPESHTLQHASCYQISRCYKTLCSSSSICLIC